MLKTNVRNGNNKVVSQMVASLAKCNLALSDITIKSFYNSLYQLQHTEKWIKPKKQRKEISETFDITIETQINVRKHWWSGFFTFWQTSHRFSSLIPVSWIRIFKLLLNISKGSPVFTAHGTICLNSPLAHHSRTQALLEWSHTSLLSCYPATCDVRTN